MNDETQTTDPLDILAGQAAQLGHEAPQGMEPDPAAQAAQDEAAAKEMQMMAAMEHGTAKVFLFLAKMGRSKVGQTLPEIHDEWTDPVLEAPSEALVQVVKSKMAFLIKAVGTSPEVTVFAITLLPVMMGLMSAQERHENNLRAVALAKQQGQTIDAQVSEASPHE